MSLAAKAADKAVDIAKKLLGAKELVFLEPAEFDDTLLDKAKEIGSLNIDAFGVRWVIRQFIADKTSFVQLQAPDRKIQYAVPKVAESRRVTFKRFMQENKDDLASREMPKNIKLAGPYVAVKDEDTERRTSYNIKKIMSDDQVQLKISVWYGKSDDDTGGMWTFRPTTNVDDILRAEINYDKADMSPVGVRNVKALTDWARRHMQNLIDRGIVDQVTIVREGLARVDEGTGISIPKGVATLPKRIMVGTGGYYLELKTVKPIKATFEVKRMLGEEPGITMTISKRAAYGKGPVGDAYMLQAHGEPLANFTWTDRSILGTLHNVKPFDVQSIRQFMRGVIEKAGLDKLAEDKKEDGVKKSYLDFRGSSKKKELKDEMKREIKRFNKMDHTDKAAYPDDWTADQKYKAELKKKGKRLPKSEHTKEFERRYGK